MVDVVFQVNPLHSIHLNTIAPNRYVRHSMRPIHVTIHQDINYFLWLLHTLCVMFVKQTYDVISVYKQKTRGMRMRGRIVFTTDFNKSLIRIPRITLHQSVFFSFKQMHTGTHERAHLM